MELLKYDKIKIDILNVISKNEDELSMKLLRKKIGLVKYNSLVRNCEFLYLIEFINIDVKTIEGRKYYFISITDSGIEHLKLINRVQE